MQLEELRQRLKFYNLRAVALATGIEYQKVYWIASGRRKNPDYATVQRLIAFVNGG